MDAILCAGCEWVRTSRLSVKCIGERHVAITRDVVSHVLDSARAMLGEHLRGLKDVV